MLQRLVMLVFAMAMLPGGGYAQEARYFVNHLTKADGLLDAVNYFVTRDSRGLVWISSVSGWNCYDGSRVITYTANPTEGHIQGQYIQSKMFETPDGDLYFTTYDGGINCFRRKFARFEAYPLLDSAGQKAVGYHAFHIDEQLRLWTIVENKYLYLFDTRTKEFSQLCEVPFETQRFQLVTDEDGQPVLGVSASLNWLLTLTYFEENRIAQNHRYLLYDGDTLQIKSTATDGDSLLWFTSQFGLFSYHYSSGKLQRHSVYSSEISQLDALAFLNSDTLLFYNSQDGILFYDCRTKKIVKQLRQDPGNQHGLSSTMIPAITVLPDAGVWCNIYNYGVDFFYPAKAKFQVISLPEHLQKGAEGFDVTSIEELNGRMYCGTSSYGVLVFDPGGKLVEHRPSIPLKGNESLCKEVHSLLKDSNGRLWISSSDGVFVCDENRNRTKHISKEQFLAIHQLRDGRIVAASRKGGLHIYREETPGHFNMVPLQQISTDDHFVSLWADSYGRLYGVNNLVKVQVFEPQQDFALITELPISGEVTFLEQQGGKYMWMGSVEGLVRLPFTLNTNHQVVFSSQHGLPSSNIISLLQTGDLLWIVTEQGITRMDIAKTTFTNYNVSDGLPAETLRKQAIERAPDGSIWVGTVNGIVVIDPQHIKPYELPAKVMVSELRVNDVVPKGLICALSGALNVSELEYIILPPEQNTLSFTLSAQEYSHPKSNTFSYYMEGLENGWLDAGRNNFVRYSKIPGGRYVFRFRASNSDQIWGPQNALQIYIKPPFYQTWPFYSIIALLCLAGLFSIMHLRAARRCEKARIIEEKKQALEKERQRIARDMHDDLGSSLSALSLLTQMALNRPNGQMRQDMEKINAYSMEVSKKLREVIWMVNAQNDSLQSLVSYLFSHANQLSENTEIEFNISLPDELPSIMLVGEYRRNIYLCFKEILNNALKHSEASQIDIKFQIENLQLAIIISDNGKGFDPALLEHSSGNGLHNIQERMRGINGNGAFQTGPQGTTVVLSLDLAHLKHEPTSIVKISPVWGIRFPRLGKKILQ